MSQPNTPFNDYAIDSFLPIMSDMSDSFDPDLNDLDSFFPVQEADQPTFSAANSDVLDDLDLDLDVSFDIDDCSTTQTDSTNPTTVSTPDFSGYAFGQRPSSSTHLTPGLDSQRPCLSQLQIQHSFYPYPNLVKSGYPPLPIRSHTNYECSRHPPHQFLSRVHQPRHRRSLSQGDADLIAATNASTQNPTLFSLQGPRARSTTPEDKCRKRKGTPYEKPAHASSQGSRRNKSSHIPTSAPSRRLSGGNRMLLTPIDMPSPFGDTLVRRQGTPIQLTGEDVEFKHMSYRNQFEGSRRVIEVGAMAVFNAPKNMPIDTDSDYVGGKIHESERILKKLYEVEQHLKCEIEDEACAAGLAGCEVIRKALLAKSAEAHGDLDAVKGVESTTQDAPESDHDEISMTAPSEVFNMEDNEMYNSTNDNCLFSLLADADLVEIGLDES